MQANHFRFPYIYEYVYTDHLFFYLKKKTILINKAIYCFLHVRIVLLKTSFIKRRKKNLISNIREWTMSGNVKMVIATSNDEINYRNHFVVLPLMNREVTLKTPIWTWFESDKWIKLGRPEIVPSSSLKDNEKSNLSMRRTTTAKYYFIYITYISHDKCFTFKI